MADPEGLSSHFAQRSTCLVALQRLGCRSLALLVSFYVVKPSHSDFASWRFRNPFGLKVINPSAN